jgi:hypothetical protein
LHDVELVRADLIPNVCCTVARMEARDHQNGAGVPDSHLPVHWVFCVPLV